MVNSMGVIERKESVEVLNVILRNIFVPRMDLV